MRRDTSLSKELRRFADLGAFLDDAGAELELEEARHSLLLGLAGELKRSGAQRSVGFVVREAGRLVLAALLGPDRRVVAAATRPDPEAGAKRLVEALAVEAASPPTALAAAAPLAEQLVEQWREAGYPPAREPSRQRLHRLTQVAPVPRPSGAMRVATTADADRVAEWAAAFESEALGARDGARARRIARRRVASGEIRIWDDAGTPCAMAAWARPTRNGVSVNAVYTPPHARGRGYATALVADLSRRLLAEGRHFCVLYTDAANRTANAIYARVGYLPIDECLYCVFEGTPSEG